MARSDKVENKYSDSEISEIVATINMDIVSKIVENTKLNFLSTSEFHESDFDANKNNACKKCECTTSTWYVLLSKLSFLYLEPQNSKGWLI